MSNRSEAFGRLLKGAINSIAAYEGKTAQPSRTSWARRSAWPARRSSATRPATCPQSRAPSRSWPRRPYAAATGACRRPSTYVDGQP
jgi:hypothetical protein